MAKNKNADNFEVPQEVTESYGTGVKDLPGVNIGDIDAEELAEYTISTPSLATAEEDAIWHESDRLEDEVGATPTLTGGDIDARWEEAATVGDEAVGGTAPTPDQDIVDELGAAVGLEMSDRAFLRTTEILEQRDDRRWELDPMSSEDYEEHQP